MNMSDLAVKRRSIRKFRPEPIGEKVLRELVDIARLYPSGGNLQPLKFALVTAPEKTNALFADLKWAMYLPDYAIGPDERPTAYVVFLRDETISKACAYDLGAASTMLMLAATERGIATCAIGNFSREKAVKLLKLPENLKPELVLAMGYPAQESFPVPMEDTFRYSRDEAGNFLVPKRSLEEVIV